MVAQAIQKAVLEVMADPMAFEVINPSQSTALKARGGIPMSKPIQKRQTKLNQKPTAITKDALELVPLTDEDLSKIGGSPPSSGDEDPSMIKLSEKQLLGIVGGGPTNPDPDPPPDRPN